jgi:hypothetical protein
MFPIARPLLLVFLPMLAWHGSAIAQAPPVLTLKPAVIVGMPTEAGKVYQLQDSPDLVTWQDCGTPVFGTGAPIRQPMAGENQRFFRLKVLTEPAIGPAPWSLNGLTLQFNEVGRIVCCTFNPNGSGTWETGTLTRPFTWAWQRSSAAKGQVTLTFPAPAREILQLKFSAPLCGSFTRRTFNGPHLADSDSGSFGPAPAAAAAPNIPAAIINRPIAFCELNCGGSITLTDPTHGHRLLDGVSSPFGATLLVSGASSVRLTATLNGGTREQYQFTFTSPDAGHFIRQTFARGVLRDEDEGCFCLGNAP